ncbi:hypothetical protein ASPWEDRAFT_284571 [Aspergillus wentii DTO 134E9]|uniref:histone acetyltransferase n=1 Tax=Aspergillus wentii DTO 134E9 TaxID=1073089 RepID=A0A1L9S3L2_ASPWE|nr:uncharacterized protein ASPWEDRAFT_284571 [Aspergillus wentii DTO 134E9]KAI9930077.1 hypothetical protein MW887_011887 [Aspergillus wentii]OJJ41739.1 hypothetical protein ASPWEDRAFT_284571 [Aspergillus wentii DTO 134E9]
MSTADADLGSLLAKVLPADVKVTIRHVSSVPTQCVALFAAPPGEAPETTFCENHFLTASINIDDKDGQEVIVFGIEVLVYSSAHLTTIFVSKADSTGYLHLLKNAPKVSLLRLISNTFLSYLVHTRQRPGVRLVVSLFARAQNQYLFPGSIDNAGKHVLDDRGLIKWWCRAVDPILREYEPESGSQEKGLLDRAMESAKSSATAFLIVPGCDRFETRGFFPSTSKVDNKDRPRWRNSYPLRQLCTNPDNPPRCLIPRFPDDPKTRFLDDLDGELPERTETGASRESSGKWRSVRSLEQFWEMMSFRQECSAGRLVGFLWLVINPPGLENSVQMASSRFIQGKAEDKPSTTTPEKASDEKPSIPAVNSETPPSPADSTQKPESSDPKSDEKPVTAAQPASSSDRSNLQQASDVYPFSWPEAGRGHATLNEADYKTATDFLFQLDFDSLDVSIASSKAWAEKVASLADQLWVGQHVVGRNTTTDSAPKSSEANNLMDSGFIRKRKKTLGESDKPEQNEGKCTGPTELGGNENAQVPPTSEPPSGVNMLNASVVRKKKKT